MREVLLNPPVAKRKQCLYRNFGNKTIVKQSSKCLMRLKNIRLLSLQLFSWFH